MQGRAKTPDIARGGYGGGYRGYTGIYGGYRGVIGVGIGVYRGECRVNGRAD